MSLECNVCDGHGGYATNLEGDEVEECSTCDGTGEMFCCECAEDADHWYVINGFKEPVCQAHFDKWTAHDIEECRGDHERDLEKMDFDR